MKSDHHAPIFIVGSPRSGTTLTAKILGRHSRVFMPAENHFFEDIYARRKELGSPDHPSAKNRIRERLVTLYGRYNQKEEQDRLDNLLADPKVRERLDSSFCDYKTILNTFMDIQLQGTKKARWGNNTPKDLFHINEILSFYPDAKFIVCVRDVRDFLLSYKTRWKATSEHHRSRLRELYHPVITSLLWKSNVRRISALKTKIPKENMMIIKYEELVHNPEQIGRQVCQLIGEEFEPDMLNITTNNSSDQTESKGIFTSSVGKWRGKLGNEEVFIAQWINRRELAELEYSLEKFGVSPISLAKLLFSSPYALYRALAANKGKRGPLFPYLAKRVGSLFHRPS